ncbi:unnamed protein product, partial [Prorocentrum cordatum]
DIHKDGMFPKGEGDDRKKLKGITGIKESELMDPAKQVSAQAHTSPETTRGGQRIRARKAAMDLSAPRGAYYVEFGKHCAMTHQEARSQCLGYARRYVQQAGNADSSTGLEQYASWLNAAAVAEDCDPLEGPKPKEDKISNMQNMMQEMVGAISQLSAKAKGLEASGSASVSETDKSWQELRALSTHQQRLIAHAIWEQGGEKEFEVLMAGHDGVHLMELRCSPMSSLGSEMEKKGGKGRGPLSPVTMGLNGRSSNPAPVDKTRQRRVQAIRECKGAVQVACDQAASGRAHNMIRTMVDDLEIIAVRVAGCELGAKTSDGGIAKKEWLVAATPPRMAARLEVECPRGHVHKHLQGRGVTAASAYSPAEMARRAVGAMLGSESGDYLQFVKDATTCATASSSEKPDKPVQEPNDKSSPYEDAKIHSWRASVHRGRGRASRAAMKAALRRQGAPERVIDACMQQPPALLASLEGGPAKWRHIQAGQFEWRHPCLKEKLEASMITDEGRRVRVAKWQ